MQLLHRRTQIIGDHHLHVHDLLSPSRSLSSCPPFFFLILLQALTWDNKLVFFGDYSASSCFSSLPPSPNKFLFFSFFLFFHSYSSPNRGDPLILPTTSGLPLIWCKSLVFFATVKAKGASWQPYSHQLLERKARMMHQQRYDRAMTLSKDRRVTQNTLRSWWSCTRNSLLVPFYSP